MHQLLLWLIYWPFPPAHRAVPAVSLLWGSSQKWLRKQNNRIKHCCFWSGALTAIWLLPPSVRHCKRSGVFSPILNTAFIRLMVWRLRINGRYTAIVLTTLCRGRTNPACAWCTTGFICRVRRLSRIIYKKQDICCPSPTTAVFWKVLHIMFTQHLLIFWKMLGII